MTLCNFFFFFQAEDGIRDYKVTGVQTCALPISGCSRQGRQSAPPDGERTPPSRRRTRVRQPAAAWEGESRRSEEHTSELQSPCNLVCRLLLEKKKKKQVTQMRNQQMYKSGK